MLTLVIEFGRQRKKFDFKFAIDIETLEKQIKSKFGIEENNFCEYFIQIYDDEVKDYLDLTSDLFLLTTNRLIKGRLLFRQMNSNSFQMKVTKQQIVGLITLESIENSFQNWIQLLQNIQLQMIDEIKLVRRTIENVKSHYRLTDEVKREENIHNRFSPINCLTGKEKEKEICELVVVDEQSNVFPLTRQCSSSDRQSFSIQYSVSVAVEVIYQRFARCVHFQGELSIYYNPTYFFIRISNQRESYDEMQQEMNLFYNRFVSSKSFFAQSGDFCVAKSVIDCHWYRSRIIRLVENDQIQLIFIDTGEICQIHRSFVEPLQSEFAVRPAQALACSLAQILPITQNDRCGWNRRSAVILENLMKSDECKCSLEVAVVNEKNSYWPMMLINLSTKKISNLSEHLCELYLTRRASNEEISEFWCDKIFPNQFVFFNLFSSINEKDFPLVKSRSNVCFNENIDFIINDLQFACRQ